MRWRRRKPAACRRCFSARWARGSNARQALSGTAAASAGRLACSRPTKAKNTRAASQASRTSRRSKSLSARTNTWRAWRLTRGKTSFKTSEAPSLERILPGRLRTATHSPLSAKETTKGWYDHLPVCEKSAPPFCTPYSSLRWPSRSTTVQARLPCLPRFLLRFFDNFCHTASCTVSMAPRKAARLPGLTTSEKRRKKSPAVVGSGSRHAPTRRCTASLCCSSERSSRQVPPT